VYTSISLFILGVSSADDLLRWLLFAGLTLCIGSVMGAGLGWAVAATAQSTAVLCFSTATEFVGTIAASVIRLSVGADLWGVCCVILG